MVLTRINNNVSALNASRNLNQTSLELARSLERLSSGLRINRAADDAAGLSISERQRSQIRGLRRAIANAQDAISLVNTSEGALNETTNRLQRIRELAVQAANSGGQDADAIQAAQDEIETAIAEITRIGNTTQFSTRLLLNGDNANSVAIRAGSPSRGVSVAQTTVASSLPTGTSFLQITQTQVGTETLAAGSDGVVNVQVSDITGATFSSGAYALTVSNVQRAAIQRVTTGDFTVGSGNPNGTVDGNDLLTGITFAGIDLATGHRVNVTVTLNDGTQVSAVFLAQSTTFTQLLNGIRNLMTGPDTSNIFATNLGTAAAQLVLTAGFTGESRLGISISIDTNNDGLADATQDGTITTLGSYNQAVLTLGGGPAQTVRAGQTVTLYGREPTDPARQQPRMTLTIGAAGFISEGTDMINVVANQYRASLNGGRAVTIQNGDREVLFRSGTAAGFSSGEFLLLNFAENINLSGTPSVGLSATVILTATNNGLNFQIGANEGQSLVIGLDDLRASHLGFLEGLVVNGITYDGTVDSIDVRTMSGAENAIRIVDRALAQVNRVRSYLGATTNRLEATIANLGVAEENLTAAESRIRDADIAFETTRFTRNQILLQAGTAILAQANLAPQAVLQLLG